MSTDPLNPHQSDSVAEIGTALAKAQGEISHAAKEATGQIGQNRNYKYADLATVIDTLRPVFTKYGISTLQRPMHCDDGVRVQTMLLHTSGEWITDGGIHVPAAKNDAQGYGSAMTYARRYGLLAMGGIATEDDDGKAASKPPAITTASDEQKELIVSVAVAGGLPAETNRAKLATLPAEKFDATLLAFVKHACERLHVPLDAAPTIAKDITAAGTVDVLTALVEANTVQEQQTLGGAA